MRTLRIPTKLGLCVAAFLVLSQNAYALSGAYHRPYGKDDLYVSSDANTDRSPLDRYAGQSEYVKVPGSTAAGSSYTITLNR